MNCVLWISHNCSLVGGRLCGVERDLAETMKHFGCTGSTVGSSVLRIETPVPDRVNQIGMSIALYVELQQLGISHSLSFQILVD